METKLIFLAHTSLQFVDVHQALLETVIGKHGILKTIGVGSEVAVVLRGVEHVVDETAFALIAEVPHCADEATAQKISLDQILEDSIDTS